jgi:hypothetical protein
MSSRFVIRATTSRRSVKPSRSRRHKGVGGPLGHHFVDGVHGAAGALGIVHLDADTSMSPGTFEAALRASSLHPSY